MTAKGASKRGGRKQAKPSLGGNGLGAIQRQRQTVQRLAELTASIFNEVEALVIEDTLAELLGRRGRLGVATGIGFYDEVARFEIDLITLALRRANGNQARAARMLSLRPTTLNEKIKHHRILY